MMRRLLLAIVLAGCAKHATREQAQTACEHQVELGYWDGVAEGLTKQGLDAHDPQLHAIAAQQLAAQQQTDEWRAAVTECTDAFFGHASPSQIACVMAATTSDAASACLK